MNTKATKQSVVKSYGLLAKSKNGGLISSLFACCGTGEHADKIAEQIGYDKAILDEVPEDANLGIGCGNPSALSEINKGETIIDLGSGAGFDAFIVSRIVGQEGKVIGIDLSDDMLKLARKNAKKGNYSNTEFLKGDIEKLPLESNIADHVISNCVINLSTQKDLVFKEAYRVLKPGASLSISDIVLVEELPEFVKNSLAGHIACVSGAEKIEDYLSYIKDAGFTEITIKSKKEFPLELMLTDPQVKTIAKAMNFDLSSDEAKDIASRVTSISLTAVK